MAESGGELKLDIDDICIGRLELRKLEFMYINPGRHEECISSVEHNPCPEISAISESLQIGIDAHCTGVGGGRLHDVAG